MSKLYQQLVQDHINLTRLLETLQYQIADYDQEDWYQPQLPTILGALDYIRIYAEVFHHPLEEHVFDYLLERDTLDRKLVTTIISQHDELEIATEQLQEQFDELSEDVSAPIDELKENLQGYLRLQLNHLAAENEKIFPAIAQLDSEAWCEIKGKLAFHRTPLFCNELDQGRYTTLIRSLIER
jgi:hemerythrin-like domain-containing protein